MLDRATHPVVLAAVVAILVLGIVGIAVPGAGAREARIKAPSYALEAGHHKRRDGDSWGVWIFGNQEGRQCWLTSVRMGGLPNRSEACGYSVPRHPWQLAVKGPVGGHESILFFLTRPHLKSLNVLSVTKNGRRRIIIPVHKVSASEAVAARLGEEIGYAVARVKGAIGKVVRVHVLT